MAELSSALARSARPIDHSMLSSLQRWSNRLLPLATVLVVIIVGWYALAAYFNLHFLDIQVQNLDPSVQHSWHRLSLPEKIQRALSTSSPTMPTPVQTVGDFLDRVRQPATANGSLLIDLAWTGQAALLGFLLGAGIGVVLALLFMTSSIVARSLLPYVIASQTIPVVALVLPIMIVLGLGLRSEVLIAAYLAFFSITISTYKGLQSVQPLAFDLMRSYAARPMQVFLKLRMPAALPFLFTGLKVGVTASLVGAIIAELPSGSIHGLGQGLVAASTYSNNIQLWSTMFSASVLGLILYGAVVLAEKLIVRWNVEPEV